MSFLKLNAIFCRISSATAPATLASKSSPASNPRPLSANEGVVTSNVELIALVSVVVVAALALALALGAFVGHNDSDEVAAIGKGADADAE